MPLGAALEETDRKKDETHDSKETGQCCKEAENGRKNVRRSVAPSRVVERIRDAAHAGRIRRKERIDDLKAHHGTQDDAHDGKRHPADSEEIGGCHVRRPGEASRLRKRENPTEEIGLIGRSDCIGELGQHGFQPSP